MKHELIGRKCTIKDSGSVRVWEIVGHTNDYRFYLACDGKLAPTDFRLDRLEILPLIADKRLKHFDFGVHLDAPRVTHDEATELFAHMMTLAHMYFQATPDGMRDEVKRVIAMREGDNENGVVMVGVLAAFDAWTAKYEELKADD